MWVSWSSYCAILHKEAYFWDNKTIHLIIAVVRERQILHISVLQRSTDTNGSTVSELFIYSC